MGGYLVGSALSDSGALRTVDIVMATVVAFNSVLMVGEHLIDYAKRLGR